MVAAATALDAASRTVVAAAGLSAAAYRLHALGCVVDAPADPLTAQLAAAQLLSGAVCRATSHTGATRGTVDTARRAAARASRSSASPATRSRP
ncbi:hypothetical protein ACGF8B_29855 [Streptomyces sp. NPDC047917]|uniref:hypothetical protein n=1 Tax=Streptomyces sp. NPDC047917 TaxID=3365491 RepID=UPI00371A8A5B